MTDICKGCLMSRYNNERYCTYYLMSKTKECPCTTCLVKVMCGRLCTSRSSYREERVPEVSLANRDHI